MKESDVNNSESYILSAAVEYATRGWVVHALTPPTAGDKSAGKRPTNREWQKNTTPPTKAKLEQWFGGGNPKGYNLGLRCGAASDVTVIDLDRMIYADIFDGVRTLRSSRTSGRGHVFFKYNPNLPSSKHHNLGIEVLSESSTPGNGTNIVLPPSIHKSGGTYNWDDPAAPLAEMPENIEVKLKNLFEREKDFNQLIKTCRPCFAKLWKKEIREKTDFHGAEGRDLMLAWGTDLKAAGATLADAEMWAKVIYGDGYDRGKTLTEWRNIDQGRPWKCATIAERLSGVLTCECDTCVYHPTSQPRQQAPARSSAKVQATPEKKYEVLNYELFRKLAAQYPEVNAELVDAQGGAPVYQIDSDEFIQLALGVDAIVPYAGDDGKAVILTNPDSLLKFITRCEVRKDGQDTVYHIMIREEKIDFGIKELLDVLAWREKLTQCNLIISFDLRANARRDAWSQMICDVLNRAEITWEEEMSGEDLYTSVVMGEIQKLIEVGDRAALKLNPVSFLIEDGAMLVKTDTMREIIERKKIPYDLTKLRYMLAGHLTRSTKQLHIQNAYISVWCFKKGE